MQYVPILMVFAISLGVACLLAYLPALLGPRRATPIKLETFECGKDVLARPEGRFAIKFSTTAIFFIIFDIELMFVFPGPSSTGASGSTGSSRWSCTWGS